MRLQFPRTASRQHPKILVADHEASVVRYASEALQRAGYAVITTVGYEEVLEKAKAEAVQLILLGVRLRPQDQPGCEIVKALRADSGLSNIPVLLLTGKTASAEDIPECVELPAVRNITKPFAPAELLTLIKRYFPDLSLD